MLGSFMIWDLSISLLFDHTVNVLHPDEAFGEPIWVIDPLGFMIISVPTGLVFILGGIAFLGSSELHDKIVGRRPRADVEL
ncbi:MAG: hypothetical protein ACXAEN_18455 [Candidatus Thorarchaeota archaeon]|jgi:hypothetical protein